MRIQHVAQAVKGWPDATAKGRQEGARLADIVDQHIRWCLWHGQVQRSLNLIGDTLVPLDVMAKREASTAVPAAKVAGVIIIDYATARRSDEPISTATTESTVQWLLQALKALAQKYLPVLQHRLQMAQQISGGR
jgi:hypothetical protein